MLIPLFIGWLLLLSVASYTLRSTCLVRRLSAIGALVSFGLSLAIVWFTPPAPLIATLLILVALVYLAATLVSQRYMTLEESRNILSDKDVRRYFALQHLFMLTLIGALLADHVGMLWIALEGPTLATTLLVSLYRKEGAVEAAWKYIVLCSIGISLGLMGILLFVHAAMQGGLSPEEALSLTTLLEHARDLNPETLKWAVVFVFIGLGTKVGFVPMHPWLPDAHSKTPSPISAMLSGVLLNVALVTILRFRPIVDVALGNDTWTSGFFLTFGVISVTFAALIILQSKNYKRTLAYSSIEHMGLIAFFLGLGPLGLVPAVVHMIGHTLAKSLLFFESGEILLAFHTTKTDGVRELLKRLPKTSVMLMLGLLLLLAVPPSPLFFSEVIGLGLGMQSHPVLTVIILLSLTLVAYGMLRSGLQMNAPTAGEVPEHAPMLPKRERFHLTHAVALCEILLLIGVGALTMILL